MAVLSQAAPPEHRGSPLLALAVMRTRGVLVFSAGLLCAGAPSVAAQTSDGQTSSVKALGTAAVRGIVTDAASGAPIRALVTLVSGARSARADDAGHFRFSNVQPGELSFVTTAFGFRMGRTTVHVQASDTVRVTIALTALPHLLDPVRATTVPDVDQARAALPAGTPAISVSSRELSAIPAVGEADVLRAMSLLPGIAARNDFWTGFNVRGGESDQTQVRLDGFPVVSPFHLGGLFSTFIADAVRNVDAHVGGLPASFGGRLSGVLDVSSSEELRTGVHGTVDLSAIATSARVGGALPFAPGSWNAALRRTYVDMLASALRGAGSFPYHFQDALFHAVVQTRSGGTFAATAYTGLDVLNPAGGGDENAITGTDRAFRFDWGNTLAGVTFTQPLGAAAELVQRVAYTRFHTSFAAADSGAHLVNHLGELRLNGEVMRRFGGVRPVMTVRAGYEFSQLHMRYDEHLTAVAADDVLGTNLVIDDTLVRQATSATAAFGEALWTPTRQFSVRGGVRAERIPNAAWHGVSPRLAIKYRVHDRLSFSAALGRYAQWTHAVRNEDLPVPLVDIWFLSDASVPVSGGTERVVGSELWFSSHDFVRVDGYDKQFTNLVEPTSAVDPRLRPAELRRFSGTSRGLEVLLRHVSTTRWSGWLSYSLARSIRQQGNDVYFPAHDRRHDLNLVASYALNPRTTFGARLGVASGTPYTGWAGTYARWAYDPVARRWRPPGLTSNALNEQIRTSRNSERYPGYSRFDVSAQRTFHVKGHAADGFFNLINVLGTRNVLGYAIDNEQSPPVLRGFSQLPFLPTVGIRATF